MLCSQTEEAWTWPLKPKNPISPHLAHETLPLTPTSFSAANPWNHWMEHPWERHLSSANQRPKIKVYRRFNRRAFHHDLRHRARSASDCPLCFINTRTRQQGSVAVLWPLLAILLSSWLATDSHGESPA